MMGQIKYKVDLLEGNSISGEADSIVIRDNKNILTIGNQHAPLISVLECGAIEVFKLDGNDKKKVNEWQYQEGFLNCQNNICEIFLLK